MAFEGELLSPELFAGLSQLMRDYVQGKVPIVEAVNMLESLGERGRVFHFNLNSDIGRLVICRYPRKITFDGVDVQFGEMFDNVEYESRRIMETRTRIMERIGNRRILGIYGQLSFTSQSSEAAATECVCNLCDVLNFEEDAVLHSGSLLGVGGIAHREAIRRGVSSIGIVPSSIGHVVDSNKFSLLVVEGSDWGDASFLFGGLPDQVVFFGGGYWSYFEYKKAKEFGKNVLLMDFEGVRYCEEFGR